MKENDDSESCRLPTQKGDFSVLLPNPKEKNLDNSLILRKAKMKNRVLASGAGMIPNPRFPLCPRAGHPASLHRFK